MEEENSIVSISVKLYNIFVKRIYYYENIAYNDMRKEPAYED